MARSKINQSGAIKRGPVRYFAIINFAQNNTPVNILYDFTGAVPVDMAAFPAIIYIYSALPPAVQASRRTLPCLSAPPAFITALFALATGS